MKIVYASRTGNVEILMDKLNINNPTRIMSGDEKVDMAIPPQKLKLS